MPTYWGRNVNPATRGYAGARGTPGASGAAMAGRPTAFGQGPPAASPGLPRRGFDDGGRVWDEGKPSFWDSLLGRSRAASQSASDAWQAALARSPNVQSRPGDPNWKGLSDQSRTEAYDPTRDYSFEHPSIVQQMMDPTGRLLEGSRLPSYALADSQPGSSGAPSTKLSSADKIGKKVVSLYRDYDGPVGPPMTYQPPLGHSQDSSYPGINNPPYVPPATGSPYPGFGNPPYDPSRPGPTPLPPPPVQAGPPRMPGPREPGASVEGSPVIPQRGWHPNNYVPPDQRGGYPAKPGEMKSQLADFWNKLWVLPEESWLPKGNRGTPDKQSRPRIPIPLQALPTQRAHGGSIGYADGGSAYTAAVGDDADYITPVPDIKFPGASQVATPQAPQPPAMMPPQSSGGGGGGGIGDMIGTVAKLAPMAMMFLAQGGRIPMMRGGYPELYSAPIRHAFADGGGERYVRGDGRGNGRSDHIAADLSPGEFVMDAETTSMLGDGDNEAGARKWENLRQNIRKHKGKALAKGKFSPNAKEPEQYMSEKLSATDRLARNGRGNR